MNKMRKHVVKEAKKQEATYVMTSCFRIHNNYALFDLLEYSDRQIIIYHIPEENKRNNDFIDNHIHDLVLQLKEYTTKVHIAENEDAIKTLVKGDLLLDMAYLIEEKSLVKDLVKNHTQGVALYESNVLVPVLVASDKEEYGARTIRPKIWKQADVFIDPVLDENHSLLELKALKHLSEFIESNLPHYHLKNHPEYNYTSGISVYLKYGILSPVDIILLLLDETHENKEVFLEEVIIRRELSYNFVYYNNQYNQFEHMTYGWAYQTMEVHAFDDKEYLYQINDYIDFKTHDPYFNAAMKEMVYFGKMHGYMRMYWCKKIIEWSKTFKEAYETAIYLNNYYFMDGNTPNGYTGVAWCFGKHDRAWTERNIFGKLRYMNDNGLKRKFDIDAYVKKIEREVSEYGISKT